MNPVIHFEMPYEDSQRMARFYETAFGWKTQALGEAMGNYVTAATSPTGPAGPTQPGSINGGFYARQAGMPEQHPSVVIAVEDIHRAMQEVRSAGGQVLGEPMEIPGIGHYVSFMDTEKNRVSMLQPLPRAAGQQQVPG
ncbi:MAG: VOC family protein [Pseudomonadota bacterium]